MHNHSSRTRGADPDATGKSLDVYTSVLGLEESGREGQSVFLRGWEPVRWLPSQGMGVSGLFTT
jgi:hypothetical protein